MTDAEEAELVEALARALDRPSVYMGGSSEQSKRKARELLPIIEAKLTTAVAEERERCAAIAEARYERDADGNPAWWRGDNNTAALAIATAIRSLKETPNDR